MISLDGAIVVKDGQRWLIESASDLESVEHAIISAAVSGSVGCSSDTVTPQGVVVKHVTE